jgi:hypothetical protein
MAKTGFLKRKIMGIPMFLVLAVVAFLTKKHWLPKVQGMFNKNEQTSA